MDFKLQDLASLPDSDGPPTVITVSDHCSRSQCLSPSEELKPSWGSLFAFTTWKHAIPFAAAIISAALVAAFRTVLAVILGRIFDAIASFGDGTHNGSYTLTSVTKWCLVLLGLGIGNWAANTLFLALWVTFGELQANAVRHGVFTSLLNTDMAWFDSLEQGISSLLVRIQTQTRELQLATSQVFGLLVCDALTSVASLAVALYYSWKLTLVLLATLPASIIALSLATRKLEPALEAQKQSLAMASKLASASMTAIDLVKVFNGFDRETRQYQLTTREAARHYLTQAMCNSLQMGIIAFWVVGMFVVGFWYGVVLVKDGLPPGHVLTTFYATLAAFQGIEALVPHWLVFSKGMSAGAFLSPLAFTQKKHNPARRMSGSSTLNYCVGDIELRNVSFAYPSNPFKTALNTSSFFFPPGELAFIIGRSGSGKSTIGNLIANFYKPLTGDVILDGRSLRVLDEKWVRSNITLIQQSSVLFNDTFFNNVAIGHPNPNQVTVEQVVSACESVLLQSTLADLPNGLDTNIGPRGYNLSGGQKQRLALARARLRDPPVLILDEITSGLDQFNRTLVMDAVREWRKGKTTIIITHDVTQINDNDFVYVIEEGSLVEEGFKRDLLQCHGPFSSLVGPPANDSSHASQINTFPPISLPNTSFSPSTNINRIGTNSISKRVLDERQSSCLQPSRPRLLRRATVGGRISYTGKPYAGQLSSSSTPPTRRGSTRMFSRYFEEGRRHNFGSFVDKYFLSQQDHAWDTINEGDLQRMSAVSTVSDVSDAPSFIFGASDRRQNISTLRHARTQEIMRERDGSPETPPISQNKGKASLLATLKTVWPRLSFYHQGLFIIGLFSCLVSAAATPAFSYCLAQLLGAMWSPGDKIAAGKKWALYIVAIAVVDGTSTFTGRYLLEIVAQSWIDSIRIEALRKILQQPRPWFDKSKNTPGRITECLERNAEEMRNIVGRFIPIVTTAGGMISISIIWALVVSWKLTLVALAPLPLVIGAVKGYAIVSGRWETTCNQAAEDSSAMLAEVLLNIRVVRALTLEDRYTDKFFKTTAHTLRLGMKRAVYTSWLFGLYQSMNYALTALVFYYGAVILSRGSSDDVSRVLQVVNLLLFSIGSATEVLGTMPQLTMAQSTAAQILGYLELPHCPNEEGHLLKIDGPLPVKMTNLKFSYSRRPGQQQALNGLSLTIESGKCTAIVGPSGCGKSTLTSLLLGLYPPSNASTTPTALTYHGIPSICLNTHHLRSKIAYVPQAPYLFPATIAENIAYGLPLDSHHRERDNIFRAAKAAGIHDFIISLPEGYNTLVGEGGQSLSGGQAHRLSIARAVVRRPQLLVMDEPTSALDVESADTIRDTIRELVEESKVAEGGAVAIVLVTHSVEMMRIADTIAVLNDGVVVEQGTYEDLWRANGPFRNMLSGGELI